MAQNKLATAQYQVSTDFVIDLDGNEKHFIADEVVELSVKEAEGINARGQASHPELGLLLVRLDNDKAGPTAED